MCRAESARMVCGVLVIALAYVSLTRLDLLSVDSQRWGLHAHQRHLARLSMAEVVVGTALALSALLGCFDVVVSKTTHRALDVVTGLIILGQVTIAMTALTLMIWVENDLPSRSSNCRDCLQSLVFVVRRLIPAIACSLLAAIISQCIAMVANRISTATETIQTRLNRANNLEEYKLKSMNELIGGWAPRKSHSWSGQLNYSGSLFEHNVRHDSARVGTPRVKLHFAEKHVPNRKRVPVQIVVTPASSPKHSRNLERSWVSREAPTSSDFSHYANVALQPTEAHTLPSDQ
ncbi:uncharacterized protein LOC120849824 [Ixodes scapularis]|uniref:uncharacterized protein LOC120849824 n=1 Tax=Ixodes scapularis TaxID=6945 RepID=UPI001A9D02D7|nr:uncharacterized protein LOC120849824 [Ixodes scapularis]